MARPLVTPSPEELEAPRFSFLDLAMLLLALASVTLVLLDVFFRGRLYDWNVFGAVVTADLLITLVFLGEFIYKLEGGKSIARVARENWFDLLGMIPLAAFVALEAGMQGVAIGAALTGTVQLTTQANAAGLIRLFRLVRIVRIAQAWSRFMRATNMTFGETVTKRIFDKYRRIIVAELTTPIMLATLTVTQEVVIRMKFLESAGKAIDAKRPEIHAAVRESLERNRVPQSIIQKPLIDKLVKDIEDAVVNVAVDTLTGPALNKVTQEMIVEVLDNFKQQMTSPEGKAALRNLDTSK